MEMAKNLDLDTVSLINKSIVEKAESVSSTSEKEVSMKQPSLREDPKRKYPDYRIKSGNQVKKTKEINGKTEDKKIVRRSISAPRLRQTKDTLITIQEDNTEIINKSMSIDNIPNTVSEDASKHINTPSDRRKSSFAYPSSYRKSLFTSTPSAAQDLRRRLSDWLEKKDKKPSSFKHLKCFGMHKIDIVEEDNKENVNTSRIQREGSYEDLKIDKPLYRDEELNETSLVLAPSDLQKLAREAVKDLYCLISEGYPKEQCEAWLKVIRMKCPEVVEDPQYWECRASLEQLRGDIGSAVECYITAVVQGAEVTSVEQSLDQLLQKFKLLDIDSSSDQKEPQKERVKAMQDFKNVFTSMIIKFAIQEKTIKESTKKKQSCLDSSNLTSKLLVTPVRRSTRLSRSLYASTPGTKICSSIQELNSDEKQKMTFQPNAALLNM